MASEPGRYSNRLPPLMPIFQVLTMNKSDAVSGPIGTGGFASVLYAHLLMDSSFALCLQELDSGGALPSTLLPLTLDNLALRFLPANWAGPDALIRFYFSGHYKAATGTSCRVIL